MPKKEVLDYIKKQMSQGYNIDSIKDKLVSAGHSKKDVDEALSHFHTKKLTNRILLVSVFLLVLISGLIYYLNTELFELKSIKEEVPVPKTFKVPEAETFPRSERLKTPAP